MEFKNIEEHEKLVDTLISNNINRHLGDDVVRQALELTADATSKTAGLNVSQEEFEKIAQVSAALVKALAKPIVLATIDSLQELNQNLPD